MKTILADPSALKVEKIIARADAIHQFVTSTQRRACCPSCHQPSSNVHSRYRRAPADLPWEGISVRLVLSVRKFFCLNDACLQKVFCERLPNVVAASARRTLRLNEALTVLGFALGGRPGARAATSLGLLASPTTLLRGVRRSAPPAAAEVTVLGVDDWAMRRGRRYGTILVDLERRRPIELLVGRDAQPLAEWLGEHPGVEIISRNRFPAYAEGASRGAPDAEQVADRFHLLKNMTEAFERIVRRHQGSLREAARRLNPHYMDAISLTDEGLCAEIFPDTRPQSPQSVLKKAENRARRQERFKTIKQMQRDGLVISVIARRMGMDRQTVSLLMQAEELPERAPAYRRVGSITRYADYLQRRWAEGCFNAAQLYREIKERGYQGCEAVVRRYLQGWRKHLPTSMAQVRGLPEVSPPAPREAAWWLLKDEERMSPSQQNYVRELVGLNAELAAARQLAQEFGRVVRERRAEDFDPWRESVARSGVRELSSFCDGLMKDEAAVRAALTSEWSNGQTEGQINRLKMLKRQMYGRAKLDLLRARFLHAA